MDDDQLIDDALSGRSAAFGELVGKYQDRLYNALAHLTGCSEDAQDVAQDAFVQAYLKLETFQRNAAFFTWLYRIAFNLAMTRRRRQKPVVSLDQSREATGELPVAQGEAPTERLEREERAGQVQAALATLSDEHRAILILREMDDCSYDEIAEVLNLPVGTVRSRLFRARMELREQLKEVVHGDPR